MSASLSRSLLYRSVPDLNTGSTPYADKSGPASKQQERLACHKVATAALQQQDDHSLHDTGVAFVDTCNKEFDGARAGKKVDAISLRIILNIFNFRLKNYSSCTVIGGMEPSAYLLCTGSRCH